MILELCHQYQRIFIHQFNNFYTAKSEFTQLHFLKRLLCANLFIFLGDMKRNKNIFIETVYLYYLFSYFTLYIYARIFCPPSPKF